MLLNIFWVFYLRARLCHLGPGFYRAWYKLSQISTVQPYNKLADNTGAFTMTVWSPCKAMAVTLLSAYFSISTSLLCKGCRPWKAAGQQEYTPCKKKDKQKKIKIFLVLLTSHIFKKQTSHGCGAEDKKAANASNIANLPKSKTENLKLNKGLKRKYIFSISQFGAFI